ncbi:MAG: GNAT family N-acetyltransferase [Chloroflexi bacterium]|nr:GNAT family N-acetyltransferase [Chloroflexota bacterium]
MAVEIREVTTIKGLKKFIRYPLTLYKGSPYYVPNLFADELNTLRADRNPAFEDARARYWMAYRENQAVGRVAAMIVPRHEEKWGEKYMRFGWIDFIDDAEVVKALMDTVENWARQEGKLGVHGPLGFTDLDREGMLVEGFDEMTTLATIYNYPYYPQRLEELGYTKDVDWIEHEFTFSTQLEEKIANAAALIAQRTKTHLFQGKKNDLLGLAPQIFDVINEAYRHLYGTVPLTEAQVKSYVNTYFGFANPDFIPLVMDENERLVAFGITFPSFSRALQKSKGNLFPFGFIHFLRALHKNDRADLYLVGVRDEYRGRGITALLMHQIFQTFKKHGIRYIETNATLENNQDILAMWKYLDSRQHKRRRAYVKHLV